MDEARHKQRVLLQAGAMRRPRWFRVKVALLAVAGEAAFQLALVFPIAFGLLLGALWFNRTLFWYLSLATLLLFWWLLQPILHVPGRRVAREAAPRLHALVEKLSAASRGLRIDEIRIDDSFNAGALELGRGWLPFRVKRVLVLGGPLLATVSPSALKAIIAHELGHFSREHGRLGHWVYRARRSWLDACASPPDASLLDRAAASFARWFAPRFDMLAFVHSRQCEYEADASAARAVGPLTLAAALAETQWGAALMVRETKSHAEALMRERPQPPADLWQLQAQHLRSRMTSSDWLDHAWDQPSSWTDTHPCLHERARALACGLEEVRAALLACRRWEPDALSAEAIAGAGPQLTPARRFEWELAHRRLREQAPLDAHWDQQDDCRLYRTACRQVDRGDVAALPLLASLIERDPAWDSPARQAMARLARTGLTERQQARNEVLLVRAEQRRARAIAQAMTWLDQARGMLAPPLPLALAPLRAALQEQPVVTAAAWGQLDLPSGSPARADRVLVLWARIDVEPMRQRGLEEDDVLLVLENQLDALFPPNTITTIVSSFASEPPPAWARWLYPVL
jgi:Zn-dependent protease with chaperone function